MVVIGAGVVGCAVALALARRGVAVALLDAEPEPALGASGTNSGILHTGFDSTPGELETALILASGEERDGVLDALGIPVLRCGALMRPVDRAQRARVAALAVGARRNGVSVLERDDGALVIPGECITDPVAYSCALANAAVRHGAKLRTRFRVESIETDREGLRVASVGREVMSCRVAVNCAGLYADSVARMVGDDSFSIYPRKGEFLVFDPAGGQPLDRILLPAPSSGTKGVLVFPTIDRKVVAGPTAVDVEDKRDWSVRTTARAEIITKAVALYPALADMEPVFAYAGLRPAGRGVNYVIEPSRKSPRLVHVAAIRSTGLSASLGIAAHVTTVLGELGIRLGPKATLIGSELPISDRPWWRRTAEHRAAVAA